MHRIGFVANLADFPRPPRRSSTGTKTNGTFVNWHPPVSCDPFGSAGDVPPDPGPDVFTKWLSKKGSVRGRSGR